tara:strand:+ start:345 stop:623 length:279 start_codon:yes stop_codon:yes gene_type:complete
MAKDDWKKRLKRIKAENKKKKLEQGKPWRRRGFGISSSKEATRRGLRQSGRTKRQSTKKCSMCGKKVSQREQHESISGSPLCKECAKARAGR